MDLAMIRSTTTRQRFLVALGLALAAIVAMLCFAFRIAEADIATTEENPNTTQPINIIPYKSIARNLVVDQSIPVCTSDYRISMRDAVEMWNNTLDSDIAPLLGGSNNAFEPMDSCPTTATTTYISYVHIAARDPSGDRFFCSGSGNACLLVPPRSQTPHETYTGALQVLVNSSTRPPQSDGLQGNGDPAQAVLYERLRRTIAHELGHVVGLGDYDCTDPRTVVFESLMCNKDQPYYPLKTTDIIDYVAIYEPNVVSRIGPYRFACKIDGLSGAVVFRFDAKKVVAEEDIILRRWNEDDLLWIYVESFAPETQLMTWVGLDQPTDAVYRLFSTTQANIRMQCRDRDRLCSGTSTNGNMIGFATDDFQATDTEPAPHIDVGGAVQVNVVGAGKVIVRYQGATAILTPVPLTDVYSFTQGGNTYTSTAVLSEFASWSGPDAAANNCIGKVNCILYVDDNKSLTATFVPLYHTLQIELPTGGSLTSHPAAGVQHSYTAGTLVSVRISGFDTNTHVVDWTGCTKPLTDGRCEVHINEDKQVSVSLKLVPPTLNPPSATSSAITLTWDEVDAADGYDVRIVETTGTDCNVDPDQEYMVGEMTMSQLFRGLSASTTHLLCVRATLSSNPDATSDWASVSRTTLSPPPPPKELESPGVDCLTSRDTGVNIAWRTCCASTRAATLLSWLVAAGDSVVGVFKWDGSQWLRYARVDGMLVPGSTNFTISGGAVLWLDASTSTRADGPWTPPPTPTPEDLERLARLAAK